MKYILLTLLFFFVSFCAFCQKKNLSDTWRNKAERYYDEDKKDSALIYYQKAFHLSFSTKDYLTMANLSVDLSTMYYEKRNYLEALKWCKKGLNFVKIGKINSDSVTFKLYSSLGEMYKKLNKPDSCQYFFHQGNMLLSKKPYLEKQIPLYVIPHYNNQAIFLIDRHQFSQVEAVFDQAIIISKKNRSLAFMSVLYNNLAYSFEKQKLYELAIAQRKKAIKYHGNGDDAHKSILLLGLANDLIKLKKYEEAKPYLSNSISLYQKNRKETENQDTELTQAFCQFEIQKSEHNLQTAELTLQKIITIPFVKGSSQGYEIITKAMNEMAIIKMDNNHLLSATDYIQKALQRTQLSFKSNRLEDNPTINEQVLSFETLIESFNIKSRLLYQFYRHYKQAIYIKQASHTALKTLNAFAFVKKIQTLQHYNAFLGNSIKDAQGFALQLSHEYLLTNQNAIEAQNLFFKVMELSREISISDAIMERNTRSQIIPTNELEYLATLRKQITYLKIKIINKEEVDDKQTLLKKNLEYTNLTEKLHQEYPAYYQAKFNNDTLSLGKVQQLLPPQTSYISYASFQEYLYIMAIQQANVKILKQRIPNDFNSVLNNLQQEISTPPGISKYKGRQHAILLFQTLIKPIELFLASTKHLLISRDLTFGILPFEVLESGKVMNDYLCKTHYITYTYSIAVWSLLQPKIINKNTTIAFAPFIKTIKLNDTTFKALKKSKEEAIAINKSSFIDAEANKNSFLANYKNYKVIYLPTHAFTNDKNPSKSFIAFYPTDNREYRLFLDEIYALDLKNTRLVVLDACEAEYGQVQNGEGMISLSRAFAYSGCPSIVTTHWKANDVTTAVFSKKLNEYLQDGETIDIAIQKTRNDFWHSKSYKKFNHPFFWANFVLIGRSEPVFETSSFAVHWLWSSSIIIIVIGIAFSLVYYKKSFIPLAFATGFGTRFSIYLTKLLGTRNHHNL